MKAIKTFTEGFEEEIRRCIRCGFCQAVCPVYEATFRPVLSARGRMLLLKEVMEGTVPPSQELAAPFYECTTCRACTITCPARVKVVEVVEGARRRLYEGGHTPGSLLGVRDNILRTGNIYAASQAERIEILPPSLKEKARRGELKSRAETLLFMGCVPSYVDMKIVPSLLKPLDAAEVDHMTLAAEEVCCGFPLYLMGANEFEPHAAGVIGKIRATGARELVTPCAGCYKTFKELYPKIGGLQVEVYHSVQYLEKLIREGRIRLSREISGTATYHDPCDLGRALGIFEEPRNILKSVPGLKVVEMGRNRLQARCCGGGGGLQACNPEMARRMGAERVRDALAAGADLIVSGCAACKDNLRKGALGIPREERGKIRFMDISEIVAKSMG
ncbi:MAG: (Fe-S)-binding protein [Thermodesulfobacteriota bacterium]